MFLGMGSPDLYTVRQLSSHHQLQFGIPLSFCLVVAVFAASVVSLCTMKESL